MSKLFKAWINSALYKTNRHIKVLNFHFTQDADSLRKLKNKHENERCFIIGNGPSLKVEDLDKLKSEITFAFNRIYYIFDKTDWRPTYYCSEDNKTIFNSKLEINELDLEHKFFPINFPWDYKIHFKNAQYFLFKFGAKDRNPEFSKDIVKGIYWGNTVAYTAIQLAIYMGIKEIYLLGVDHTFSKVINNQGEISVDESIKDYFTEKYNSDHDELYIPNVELSTKAFISAREFADQNNIRIYNATRGGKLEVFERIDFDKIPI